MNSISIVVPVYGCPEALIPLHDRVQKTVKKITDDYEIILVNDGCPKGSWSFIKELCEKDKKTIGVDLSRNFGQIYSTNAGIDLASKDLVVLMDCDLQDRPEGILQLYEKISEGYDAVFVKRVDRKDNPLTLTLSKLFYKVYNYFVEGHYDGDIGNFCIVSRKTVGLYKAIKDKNKSFVPTISWMGFKTAVISLEGDERYSGKSSYSISRKIDMAINMLTSQSTKPLKAVMKIGFILALFSFLFLIVQVLRYFLIGGITEGWTSLIGAVFFTSGIELICLGGIGIYIGNIFDQIKGYHGYIISEIINAETPKKK